MDQLTLESLYRWNHTKFSLLCLACFPSHGVFKVCLCGSRCQHFFPFVGWVIFRGVTDHILCTHPPITGHWLFTLWAFMNNAAMNILYKCLDEHVFSVCLRVCLELEVLSRMVTLYLTFWRAARLFPSASVTEHSRRRCVRLRVRRSQHLSLSVCYHDHPSGCEVDWTYVSQWLMTRRDFLCLWIIFGHMSIQILCPFLDCAVCLFIAEL